MENDWLHKKAKPGTGIPTDYEGSHPAKGYIGTPLVISTPLRGYIQGWNKETGTYEVWTAPTIIRLTPEQVMEILRND